MKLKDIAKATGLSVATVSKALKNSPEISKATTDMVVKIAEEMGYKPKKPAKQTTKTIGLILPEVRSHYYAELMHALSQEIGRYGYSMVALLKQDFAEDMQAYIQKCLAYDVDGLFVCFEGPLTQENIQTLESSGVPCLLITETDFPHMMDSIYIRSEVGVSLAVDHLMKLGHEKIGYLGEYYSVSRYEALRQVLRSRNIEMVPGFIKIGMERFELGGYLRALDLLKEKELPTAVLACYDQFAYGAMRAFREHGLRVPEDISIIGFDNTVMDDYNSVTLDSITNPVEQMGRTAVKILMGAINHPETHVVQNVALQSRLVVRNSSCPPVGSHKKV